MKTLFSLLHIDLIVDNIECKLAFYKDVLGFEVFEDCIVRSDSFSLLSDGRTTSIRLVFLGVNKRSTMIELLQFITDSGQPAPLAELKFKWNLSFLVYDLEEAELHLSTKGLAP